MLLPGDENKSAALCGLFVEQMRVVPDKLTSAMRWVEVDFRLGRVRDGSHKDCWLVERAIVRAWGGTPDVQA